MKDILRNIGKMALSPRVLYVWTLVVLMVPNVWLIISEQMTMLPALAQIILPAAFYGLVLALSRTTGKMVWWLFLFIFIAAFQVVLLFLWGNSLLGVDMFINVLTTNPSEALELLGNLLSGIATIVVLYVPILIASVLQIKGRRQMATSTTKRLRVLNAIVLAVGLLTCVGASKLAQGYRVLCDLYPLNVIYNIKLTADRLYDSAHYKETSANFSFQSKSTHPNDSVEIMILAIGETERADHFQHYGYHRATTPRLAADSANIIWFDDVLSQSNTTHKSVPMLLSAASAEDYDRIYREKGIITAFKEAGYHTSFISNQRRNHSFIDTFGEEADEVCFIKDDSKEHYDAEILEHTKRLFSSGKRKIFLVVHLYGSHFVYKERYLSENATFLPDDATAARASNKESLMNAYDNSILGEDMVLDSIFHQAWATNGRIAMLYTADHGENIYDDSRELFLHASPRPSYYDIHVPFFVMTSPSYRSAYPENISAMQSNRLKPVSSNASVFHTMLSLAGISTPILKNSWSVASPEYKCDARFYLNDHNEPISIKKLKFSDEDLEMFKKHRITYR